MTFRIFLHLWVGSPRSLIGAIKRIGFSHRLQPATSTHNPTTRLNLKMKKLFFSTQHLTTIGNNF